MSTMLSPLTHSLKTPERYPLVREVGRAAMGWPELEHPKVFITGDIRLCITESEGALHPITGHYNIETAGMCEPLYTLWYAEGQVSSRHTRSTTIDFDVRGAQAGEIRTYLVAVQVVESGVQGRVVLSGMFVQVVVTSDESRQNDLIG